MRGMNKIAIIIKSCSYNSKMHIWLDVDITHPQLFYMRTSSAYVMLLIKACPFFARMDVFVPVGVCELPKKIIRGFAEKKVSFLNTFNVC